MKNSCAKSLAKTIDREASIEVKKKKFVVPP
jgi:hypothetical protein